MNCFIVSLFAMVSSIRLFLAHAEMLSSWNDLDGKFRYKFLPESCSDGTFRNDYDMDHTILGQLITRRGSSNDEIQCAPSMGILRSSTNSMSITQDRSGIVSEQSVGEFFVTNSGITMELWIKPSFRLDPTPILSIGRNESSIQDSVINICDHEGYDFQLLQIGTKFIAVFRTNDEWFEGCHMIRSDISAGELTHVLISLQDGNQSMYVHSKSQGQQHRLVTANANEPFTDALTHWALEKDYIWLLQYPHTAPAQNSSQTHQGPIIYQLSLYPHYATTQDEVDQLILQGLYATTPYAYNQSVTLLEDADDGSQSVEWYSKPASPSDVKQSINAPRIGWIDTEVRDMLLLLIGRVNQDTLTRLFSLLATPLKTVYVYLTNLPEQGTLYFLQGGVPHALDNLTITSNFILLGSAPVEDMLIYLPPHNMYSAKDAHTPFATFNYCISLSPIFEAQQCNSSASVHIHIESVNDPPVALPVPLTTVIEGHQMNGSSRKISLLGRDVDFNDTITAVQITQYPVHGYLHLAVPTFRKDLLRHGTPLHSLEDYTVFGEEAVYVNYIWDPSTGSTVVRDTTIKDQFNFRVRDRFGIWSIEETVNLEIVSAVTAFVESNTVVVEESTRETIVWKGKDTSRYHRQLGFLIEKTPSPKVGELIDPTTLQGIQAGDILHSVYGESTLSRSVEVYFQPSNDFCDKRTIQRTFHDGEVHLRAIALVNDTIVSVSYPQIQRISVICVLNVLDLQLNQPHLSLVESKLRTLSTSGCSGYNYSTSLLPNPAFCQDTLVISGISVTNKNDKAERIVVTVSTQYGYLTFNDKFWNLTELLLGRQRMASGTISFYAYPDDLINIFSNLHYQCFSAGTDKIDFELQYGNCTEQELKDRHGSFQSATCQVLRKSISVTIRRDDKKYKPATRIVVGFPWQILFCLLVYPALYIAFSYLHCSISGSDDETVVEGSPLEPIERFIQHEDENGMFYYEDTWNGTVRWDLPPCEDFVRYEDTAEE